MSWVSAKTAALRLNAANLNILSYTFMRCVKTQSVNLAARKGGDIMTSKKKGAVVESDPHVLCSRLVGGNFMAEGEDPVLGPDEDYPDWLWDLKISREPIPLEELSQDDPRYWATLKKMTLKQNLKLMKLKKF